MENSVQLNIDHNDEIIRVWLLRGYNTLDNTKHNRLLNSMISLMMLWRLMFYKRYTQQIFKKFCN